MKHILILTSYGPSLINFRLQLIKKFLSKGYKISVASPIANFPINLQKQLRTLKVNLNFFSLSRTGLNIFKDLKSILQIYKIIKKTKPNIIFSYTAKSVIYTGFLLKFFPRISYYPLITGLGFAFTETNKLKQKFIKYLMIRLYREALKSSNKIIFQNKDDRSLFYKSDIIPKKKLSNVVNGSGIDLKNYPKSSLPSEPIFLMVSRLLVDKGVREYVQASKIVRSNYSNARFQLAGYLDDNPSTISNNELQSWIQSADIEYLGELKSVQSNLKSCRYFVLPSYREGTPRSVLEALSTGMKICTKVDLL